MAGKTADACRGANGALGAVAAFVAGASFGLGGVVCQIFCNQGFVITHIAVAQYLAGGVVLCAIVLALYRRVPTPRHFAQLALLGILNAGTAFSYYLAIERLSVGQTVAIQFQYVWMTVVMYSIASRTRPSGRMLFACAAVVAGSVLGSGLVDELAFGGTGVSLDPVGMFFAVLMAVCFASFLFLNDRVAPDYPPLMRTFSIVVGGCVTASLLAPTFYSDPRIGELAPVGLVMSLVCIVVPYGGLAIAAQRISSDQVALLSSAELPAAVFGGMLILGEGISPLRLLGVCAIAVGIVAINTKGRRKAACAAGEATDEGVAAAVRGAASEKGDAANRFAARAEGGACGDDTV